MKDLIAAKYPDTIEMSGDEHEGSSFETPLRTDAFVLTDQQKMQIIEKNFYNIMHALGMDMSDDSLKDTPRRVAKMYVKETFCGLKPDNKPEISLFENKFKYDEMLIEKDITFYSTCEHHFVPIFGKVHVAYVSNGTVIGLSKINRIVQYYSARPQVQERLINQIAEALKEALNTSDVAVIMDAVHLCVASRGVKDTNSSTITAYFSGKFKNEKIKKEFFNLLGKAEAGS